jgi:hypothetical protein
MRRIVGPRAAGSAAAAALRLGPSPLGLTLAGITITLLGIGR